MTVKKMNAFMESVLTLHQSARQRSQCMLPKVLLRRLSSNTIQKYTEKHKRFHGTNDQLHMPSVSPASKVSLQKNTPNVICKSPSNDENMLGTQIKNDKGNDSLFVGNSTSTITSLELPSTESQEKRSESEDRLTDVASQSDETESSCNSDNLPDLNDPSWSKEVKTKKVKIRRKKKKVSLKTHPKLMKNARKAFEHKAFMYKLSKEFMRSSKATKEIENSESQSYHTDKLDHHCLSEVSDHVSNTMLHSLLTRPVTPSPSEKNLTVESCQKSKAEIISLKVKESLARYTEHEKSNCLSEDTIDAGLESLGTLDAIPSKEKATPVKEKANNQGKISEVLLDSDESDTTVVFDDPHKQDICHIESVHSLSVDLSVDDNDSATVAENINKLKRKDSSLGIRNSVGDNKKMRKDHQIICGQKDVDEHPMVIIPVNIANQQYCSDKVSSVPTISPTYKPQQAQTGPEVSTMASHTDNITCMGNKENSPTSVEDKEASELHIHPSKVRTAEITQSSVRRQVTGKKPAHPASSSLEESTVVGGHTSFECNKGTVEDIPVILYNSTSCGGKNSDKDNCVTGKVSGEVNQNQTPNRLNLAAASPIIKEADQEKNSSDLKKVAVSSLEKPLKSLKQMSVQFQELTTKRVELEDKIKQVKEEYNKKLEILEEQKKKFDMDIKKLIDAMSSWKELSEGDQLLPSDHEESTDANSTVSTGQPASQVTSGSLDTTTPAQTSLNTPVVAVSVSSSANSNAVVNSLPEKVAINVIPAANIRNFGTKKLATTEKSAALQADAPPMINVMRIKRTTRMVPQAPATAFSSKGGSGAFSSTSGLQPKSNASVVDQPSPPNVVVVPGQQHPVSGHMVCRMPPCPPTSQRRPPVSHMERPIRLSNPGSLHAVHKASQGETLQSLPSHMQQNPHHTSALLQKQQHHQMQQQQNQHQQQQQQLQQHQQQQQQHEHQQQLEQQQQMQQQQYQHQHQQRQQQMQQHQQQQQQPCLQQQKPVVMQGIQMIIQPQQQQHIQERQQLLKQKIQYQQQKLKQNQQQQQQQPLNQQQQASFQPSSNTQLAQQHQKSQPYLQQYQQGQGQLPSNTALLKGGAAPGVYSAPVNSSNSDSWTNAQVVPNIPLATPITTSPSSRIIVTASQHNNSSKSSRDTSTEKTAYIVSVPSMTLSANPINYVHHVQPFTSETGDSVIGLSLPPVSNFSVPGNTDRLLSVQATQAPSSNRSISQPTGVTLSAPAPNTLGQEEASEPICRMCGSTGIFTCCGDIIYCSTECQRNDWTNHQENCTNTSTPDGSCN